MTLDPRSMTRSGVGRWRTLLQAAALTALALPFASDARTGGASAGAAPTRPLLVVSNTDLKGKTGPCGCHTPKGGFARRETFIDSLRSVSDRVVAVDCGGWFPEGDSTTMDVAAFMAQEMAIAGLDAVGTSERELRFGLGFLAAQVQRSRLPLVCANLLRRDTKRPAFAPYRIVKAGGVTVGIFSLVSNTADLGPARDSLVAEDPVVAAQRTVRDLRARGAGAIVLLSNLGKVESEDLVTAVDGVDAVVVGRNVPVLQQGRTIRNSVASYGGEQGHYIAVTTLAIDATGRAAGGSAATYMLGPEVADKSATLARVKAFEDSHNEKLRAREREHAMQSSLPPGDEPSSPHYLGSEVCGRCHASEYAQWKTTAHARAWSTLVARHKDATPECVQCHVVGYQQAGGFGGAADSTKLANVQCESCHGMGTQHEAWAANSAKLTEATCRKCHTEATSPGFRFAVYQPHVVHRAAGDLPKLPPRPEMHSSMH
jgi:hypothetical protein